MKETKERCNKIVSETKEAVKNIEKKFVHTKPINTEEWHILSSVMSLHKLSLEADRNKCKNILGADALTAELHKIYLIERKIHHQATKFKRAQEEAIKASNPTMEK